MKYVIYNHNSNIYYITSLRKNQYFHNIFLFNNNI